MLFLVFILFRGLSSYYSLLFCLKISVPKAYQSPRLASAFVSTTLESHSDKQDFPILKSRHFPKGISSLEPFSCQIVALVKSVVLKFRRIIFRI
jgi:hypothetical protein